MIRFVSICLLLLPTIAINSQIVPQYIPQDGLTGYWPFEGDANDALGVVDAEAFGAVLTEDRFGNPDGAYSFDGIDDYLAFDDTFYAGAMMESLTYATWINVSGLNGTQYISGKEGFWRTIYLRILDDGSFRFGGTSQNVYFGLTSPVGVIPVNQWVHLVATLHNSIIRLYVNGEEVANGSSSASALDYQFYAAGNSTATNYLGAIHPVNPGITGHFSGSIDEFGIWNRSLTPEEVEVMASYEQPVICEDADACNFGDENECIYPEPFYDCQNECFNDSDGDGVCDELEIAGCTDPMACNYVAEATDDDNSCVNPDACGNCDPSVISIDNGPAFSSDFESCSLGDFNTEGGTIEVSNSAFEGSCAVSMTHFAGQDPNNFYPLGLNFGLGTYSVQALASSAISDNIIYLFQGDQIGGGLSISCRPENTDNPGISVNGLGIAFSENGFPVSQGQWYNVTVEVLPDLLSVEVDGQLLFSTDTFEDVTPGRFKLGVVFSGAYDNMSFEPYEATVQEAIPGCTEEAACNFNPDATCDDDSCTYPLSEELDCDGNCLNDVDMDSNCDESDCFIATDTISFCEGEPIEVQAYLPQSWVSVESVLTNDGWSLITETGSHAYWWKNEDMSWEDADQIAQSFGGYLFSPNDAAEYFSIYELLPQGNDGIHFWMGLYQDLQAVDYSEPNGGWRLSDGTLPTYFNWAQGEPSNGGGDEHVVQFEWTSIGAQWNDAEGFQSNQSCPCYLSRPIIEFEKDILWSDGTVGPIWSGDLELGLNELSYTVTFAGTTCSNTIPVQVNVSGCTVPEACNYDPLAVCESNCVFSEPFYDCQGNCLSDSDGDGVCDELEVPGCTDPVACNYVAEATDDDASCQYPEAFYDCDGVCINDNDADGVCDELEVPGCTDPLACNYAIDATDDDNSCVYPEQFYNCEGECLNDIDNDGICDEIDCNLATDTLTICAGDSLILFAESGSWEATLNMLSQENWIELQPYQGHRYWWKNINTTWVEANMMAQDYGGYLYCPNSPDEHLQVWSQLPQGDDGITFWTGMYQDLDAPDYAEPNAGWRLTDGSMPVYFDFYSNEPNNSNGDEHVVQFEWDVTGAQWNDAEGFNSNGDCECYLSRPIIEFERSVLWSNGFSGDSLITGPLYNDTTFTYSVSLGGETCSNSITIVVEELACEDPEACNFIAEASCYGGDCQYPEAGFDCEGNCLHDFNGNGLCDEFEIYGCTYPSACNYNASATSDDGTCFYADCGFDCEGNCLDDTDQDGICDDQGLEGCTYGNATNYLPEALIDDGSCVFNCPADFNNDGTINSSDLLQFLGVFGTECDE